MIRKLYSPAGALLGVLTFPDSRYLEERGVAQFPGWRPFDRDLSRAMSPDLVYHVATIVESGHGAGDGVELYGASLLEVETWPGWSFSPSLAYLRSISE
jgi:hypothetical protein